MKATMMTRSKGQMMARSMGRSIPSAHEMTRWTMTLQMAKWTTTLVGGEESLYDYMYIYI